MIHAHDIEKCCYYKFISILNLLAHEVLSLQASEASSASLNRPGRNQLMDRREDSRDDIVETLLIRKDSY